MSLFGDPSTFTLHGRQVTPLDPDGDLILRVGLRDFKVCSSAMRRASPVWKTMLFGPWKESKPADAGAEWTVELPDDGPSPLCIILGIAHGKFEHVPQTVTLDALRNILILVDKYDLMHLTKPWARSWAETVKNPSFSIFGVFFKKPNLSGPDRVLRIHAAWELGLEDIVSSEIKDFIFNFADLKPSTELETYYNNELLSFQHHFGPPDLVDIVKDLQLSLIQEILDFYHGEVNGRTSGISCQKSYNNSDRELCDTLILGGIWRYHQQNPHQGSWPEKADMMPQSANQLLGSLSEMFKGMRVLNNHSSCHPNNKYSNFEAKLRVNERWTNALKAHHKERMAAQREKTGL